MRMDRARFAFTILIFLFVLFFIVTSFSYEAKARLVPLLVGLVTLVFILAVFINEIHPSSIIERMNVDWTKDFRVEDLSGPKEEKISARKLFTIFCWMMCFFLLIFLCGFHISIVLFSCALLKLKGKVGWAKALLIAGGIWAAVFLIFDWAMGFGLFRGVLFGEIIPPI